MLKNVSIEKTQVSKKDFNTVVDRSFKTFIQPVEQDTEDQIDLFFKLYEELYFEIPIEGVLKSHRYLVEKSSQLVDLQQDETILQPLLDEIAQLREQLLQANTQVLDLQDITPRR
jgi:uncharacterized protein YoxC